MTMLAVAFWTTPRNAADISFGGIGPPSTAVSRDAMMVELCAREPVAAMAMTQAKGADGRRDARTTKL